MTEREDNRNGEMDAVPSTLSERLGRHVAQELSRIAAEPLDPGLYLVATPIGNLADITLRALSVLLRADTVYCEDTRHSRALLDRYGLRPQVRPYHEHNSSAERPRIMAALAGGARIALISDAGTPLISDPGFKLGREAARAGHRVVAVPGPSAPLAALTLSGLPTDAFFFSGFLPVKEGQRRNRIEELAAVPGTLLFFEAPTRVAATLADLAAVLGDREAAVARELTKRFEDVRRGSLGALAAEFAGAAVKGEIVIVVAPPGETAVDDESIRVAMTHALETLSLRDAAKAVSAALGIAKARAYDIGLSMKGGKNGA